MSHLKLSLLAATAFSITGAAHAQPRELFPEIEASPGRAGRLKIVGAALQRARVPAYVSFHRIARPTRSAWDGQAKGATLVASVGKDRLQSWMENVGQYSIGLRSAYHSDWDSKWDFSGSPRNALGGGEIRVGHRIFHISSFLRGASPFDAFTSDAPAVEATIPVSADEMKAVTAFYLARQYKLVLDSKFFPIKPRFVDPGPSTLEQEGCAGAASSVFNRAWRRAFARSITVLREYGRVRNIPELSEIDENTVKVLEQFAHRVHAIQRPMPKQLVMEAWTNPALGAITIFTGTRLPLQQQASQVVWNKQGKGGWRKMGRVPTLPDLGPGQATSRSYTSRRLDLPRFLRLLGSSI